MTLFPSVRISELENEVAKNRAQFNSSFQNLSIAAREKLQPLTFIRKHPKLLLTGLLSGLSFIKIFFNLGRRGGKDKKINRRRSGWGWTAGFLLFGLRLLIKMVIPVAGETLGFFWKNNSKKY